MLVKTTVVHNQLNGLDDTMTTRGIQFLKHKRVTFEVVKYGHKEKGAEYAAQAVGFPLEQTIKTLVVAIDTKRFALVLMPGDRQLSMKKVANSLSVKKLSMADTASAQRVTGYLVGGISPFGTKKELPVIMDASLLTYAQVMINAGQRGTMVKLAPQDIVQFLKARMADLSQ